MDLKETAPIPASVTDPQHRRSWVDTWCAAGAALAENTELGDDEQRAVVVSRLREAEADGLFPSDTTQDHLDALDRDGVDVGRLALWLHGLGVDEVLRRAALPTDEAGSVSPETVESAAAVTPAVTRASPPDWNGFLATNGRRWDGTTESWAVFRTWFVYEAEQAGVAAEAAGFLRLVEAGDPHQVFARYGVVIARPGGWEQFLATNGPRWDGTAQSWAVFRTWFVYEAEQAGVAAQAADFLRLVEAGDPHQVFADHGVHVPKPVTVAAPVDTAPVDTASVNTGPIDTGPIDTGPIAEPELDALLADAALVQDAAVPEEPDDVEDGVLVLDPADLDDGEVSELIEVQRLLGLRPDGVAGPATLRSIDEYLAEHGLDTDDSDDPDDPDDADSENAAPAAAVGS